MSAIKYSDKVKINIERNEIYFERPESNMQTDEACFESVALLEKSRDKNSRFRLRFAHVDWARDFNNLAADQQHYMRFLYRVKRFTEEYDWCYIDGEEKHVVDQFSKALSKVETINNIPQNLASFNPRKGREHVLENKFCENEGAYLSELLIQNGESPLKFVDHQLPNGLFCGSISKANQIFPTGFFDLWGINENNELCLFELKKETNTKMGMISELYFYTEFAHQFLLNPAKINQEYTALRSYDKLLQAVNNRCCNIRSYFLVGPEIHSRVSENKVEILRLLNSVDKQRQYSFLHYDPSHHALKY